MVTTEQREALTALSEAAEALRTTGHEARNHAVVNPEDCRLCQHNDLADRLDAAVRTLTPAVPFTPPDLRGKRIEFDHTPECVRAREEEGIPDGWCMGGCPARLVDA